MSELSNEHKIPDKTGFMSGRGLWWIHGFSEDFIWHLKRGDVGKGMSVAYSSSTA
jgi:hypothetical protein